MRRFPHVVRVLGVLLVLLLAWTAPASAAQPRPIDLSGHASTTLAGAGQFWIEDGQSMTIEQVAQKGDQLPWQPITGRARYPIQGQKALWMRFATTAPAAGENWFVEMAYSGLDRAQIFQRLPNGAWLTQEAGDTRPVAEWPIPGRFPTFALQPPADGRAATYYLRFEHDRLSVSFLPVLAPQARHTAGRDRDQLMLGAYYGLVVTMALLSIALAAVWRDRLFGWFAAFVVSMGIAQMGHLGFGAQYVWSAFPAFNRVSTFLLSPLATAVGLWLTRAITMPRRSSVWLDRVVIAVTALLPTVALIDLWAHSGVLRTTAAVLMMLMLVLCAICLALAWRRRDDPHIGAVALAYLPILLLAIVPLLSMLQLIPASAATRYATSLGSLLQMPLLLYALTQKAMSSRETVARLDASSTTYPLTGLPLASVLRWRLDSALRRAWKQSNQVALIVVQIANARAVREKAGQRALERIFVLTASRLRRLVADVDLTARIGENEFAVLLEAPVTHERAFKIAQRIQFPFGGQGGADVPMEPELRVVFAMLPRDTLNVDTVLAWMQAGLDEEVADAQPDAPHEPTSRAAGSIHDRPGSSLPHRRSR